MSRKIVVAMVIACCLSSEEARAEGFLTLPILEEASIRHGWYYVKTARYEQRHYATDYRTTDGQEIIAVCDGVAIAAESWTDSGVGAYGHFTLERCDDLALDGSHYMVIYAHLERQADSIASKSRYDTSYSGWTAVRRGDLVGYAGQSGTTWPHVHFEIFTGDYAHKLNHRVDPYNLYGLAAIYPGDGIGTGTTGYLWLTSPPLPPTDIDQDEDGYNLIEDCDDTNSDIHPGVAELCNSLDDDCDSETDETWPLIGDVCTFRPTPLCERTGAWVCEPLHRGTICDGDYEIRVERCNFLDDDCDGETDEDWPLLGVVCEAGRGVCRRSGIWECEPLLGGSICSAVVPVGTAEICDGLDNDCDGSIDESCIPEHISTYCCDGLGTIRGPAETWCVQIPGALPSELWADWDDTTCAVNGAGIRIGESCDGYGICSHQNFYGVCGWHCTSHASFCLNDHDHAYCTKQCGIDSDCPPPLTCQATRTLDSTTVNLCREVY